MKEWMEPACLRADASGPYHWVEALIAMICEPIDVHAMVLKVSIQNLKLNLWIDERPEEQPRRREPMGEESFAIAPSYRSPLTHNINPRSNNSTKAPPPYTHLCTMSRIWVTPKATNLSKNMSESSDFDIKEPRDISEETIHNGFQQKSPSHERKVFAAMMNKKNLLQR